MLVEKRRPPPNSVPSGTQYENIPAYCRYFGFAQYKPDGTLNREREYVFYQHIVPNGTDVNVIPLFSTEFIAEWRLAMTAARIVIARNEAIRKVLSFVYKWNKKLIISGILKIFVHSADKIIVYPAESF